MVSPVNLITPEFSEATGVVCTASSTAAGTAAANLLKPQPTDIWRANATTQQTIDVDLVTAQAVACAALLFTDLENGTTWSVTAGATQGATTYNSGTLTLSTFYNQANIARRHLIHLPSTPQTYRWWRFTLSAQSTAVTAGNVVLGPKWLPGVDFNLTWGFAESSDLVITDGGQVIATAPWREKSPHLEMEIKSSTEADHEENLYRIALRAGQKPVLAIREIASANYLQQRVYWGYPSNVSGIAVANLNQWRCKMIVRGTI